MNKQLKAFACITSLSVATRALSFVYKILLSRHLALATLGSYQMAMSFFMIFIAITSSGIPISISKNVAKKNNVLSSSLALNFILAIGSVLAALLLKNFVLFDPESKKIFNIFLINIIASSFYSVYRGVLWGKEEYFKFSFLEFCEQVLILATFLILLFVESPLSMIEVAGVSLTVGYVLASVLSFFFVDETSQFERTAFKKVLADSTPVTLTRLAQTAFSSLIVFLTPLLLSLHGMEKPLSLEFIGIISGIVMPLIFAPMTLVSSISIIMVPEISKERNMGKARGKIKRSIYYTILISLAIMPVFFALGEEICDFFFKKPAAGVFLSAASFAILPTTLNLVGHSALNGLSMEKITIKNFFMASPISLAVFFISTALLGEIGLVVVYYLQPTLIFILNFKSILKAVGGKAMEFLKGLLAFPLAIGGIYVIKILKISLNLPDFWLIAISSSVSVALIFSFYLLANLRKSHEAEGTSLF